MQPARGSETEIVRRWVRYVRTEATHHSGLISSGGASKLVEIVKQPHAKPSLQPRTQSISSRLIDCTSMSNSYSRVLQDRVERTEWQA